MMEASTDHIKGQYRSPSQTKTPDYCPYDLDQLNEIHQSEGNIEDLDTWFYNKYGFKLIRNYHIEYTPDLEDDEYDDEQETTNENQATLSERARLKGLIKSTDDHSTKEMYANLAKTLKQGAGDATLSWSDWSGNLYARVRHQLSGKHASPGVMFQRRAGKSPSKSKTREYM